jgi:hypothetical protein
MQIETNITARKDGTVRVAAPSGSIVFKNDGGALVADVEDKSDLAFLLSRQDFFPVDESDHVQAESLISDEQDGDDLPDDEGNENAAPIEVSSVSKAKPASRKK